MPLRTFQDGGGAPITFMENDGMYYPYVEGADQERCLKEVRNIQVRDDDVLLVNYPKSGTHWLWEIMSMLHNGKAETIPTIKQAYFLEALTTEQLTSLPSPRIFNTHMRVEELPAEALRKKTKIVLNYRNPKDIAVSLYNHEFRLKGLYNNYNGAWKDWFSTLFLNGTVSGGCWFNYVRGWEQVTKDNPDYPIHVVFYESLKENSPAEVERLAKFLELPVSSELCQQIAEKCSFSNMRQDKVGLEDEFWTKIWLDRKPGFYRKGEVGDWKNWFTVAQNEQFEEIFREKMAGSELKFRYELNN